MTHIKTTVVGGGTTFATPNGGDLRVDAESRVESVGAISVRKYGVAFDTLELTAYPKTKTTLTDISFGRDKVLGDEWFSGSKATDSDGDSWFALLPFATPAGLAATAQADDDSHDVSRRDLLRTGLVATGIAGGAAARAAALDTKLTRARVGVSENPGGLRVRILDRDSQVLPAGTAYQLTVRGIRYDEFVAGSDSYGDVPPTLTGDVTVAQNVSVLATFRELSGDKPVSYSDLQLSADPSEAPAGEQILITDHDIITRHLQKAGDESTLTINGTSVPHYSESKDSKRGWFGVRDDAIVYQVGPDPPAGTTAALTLYSGFAEEATDDASRVLDS